MEAFSLLLVALRAEATVAPGKEAAELLPAERDLAADPASAGSWKDIADREELEQLQCYCPPLPCGLARGAAALVRGAKHCTCAEHTAAK